MQVLGKGLGQPIGERLGDDRGIVVVLRFEAADEVVDAQPGRHRECADVIGDAALDRRDEVGERSIRLVVGDHFLLPQHREPRDLVPCPPDLPHRRANSTMSSPSLLAGQKP